MSFLAKLRTQQTAMQTGVRLSYAIEVKPQTRIMQLRLFLANYRHDAMDRPEKSYAIQRQHLERPPIFLDEDDIRFLTTLIEEDSRWWGQSKGLLPAPAGSELVSDILRTKRCFLFRYDGQYLSLHPGPARAITLCWRTNPAGEQQLQWRTDSGYQLFRVSTDPLSQPMIYDVKARQLCQGLPRIAAKALSEIHKVPSRLDAEQVDTFLRLYEQPWRTLDLPLPAKIRKIPARAEITPLLVLNSVREHSHDTSIDTVCLVFRYGTGRFCLVTGIEKSVACYDGDSRQIYVFTRQPDQEAVYNQQINQLLTAMGFNILAQNTWSCESEETWQRLLIERRRDLEAKGYSFLFKKNFRYPYVDTAEWNISVTEHDDDTLNLAINLDVDGNIINLLSLLSQMRLATRENHRRQIQLPDGRLLLLPKNTSGLLEEIADLLREKHDRIQLHKNQFARLACIQECLPETARWEGGDGLLERAHALRASPVIQQQQIPGLTATLRPYQKLGVCWLQHLAALGVNGLLADDMGLGKTLQTIAHLCLEDAQGRLQRPALVVAPTSLLHNWKEELQKFAPELKCLVLHGPARKALWQHLGNYQIIISSYHLVVRDNSLWQQQKLSWLILDEAQIIKNRQTRIRRAISNIPATKRLCLTGTPVENHLGEMWSILDFLAPGCLGDYSHFRSCYQTPIEEQADTAKLTRLLTYAAPFMLRRTKDQSAQDLPVKTVIHQKIHMKADQRTFYDQIRDQGQLEVERQLLNETHHGQKNIILLAALTKLRQACCDPRLLGADHVSSAKRSHCITMIRELVDEGRCLLVFSQFTRMLALLAADLSQQQIPYLMLTGMSQNRRQTVTAFQNGEAPVFLISLKAGGVGLNLTRADTVIHFDPWWNLAAEEQASDRAHRIGQEKPVFIYKLIASNTIEEKIVKLQEHKFLLGSHINRQAEASGEQFSLTLESLLLLWQSETKVENDR